VIGAADELLVVAVEASADLHGAAVLRELKALRPGLRCFGAAGPLMRAEGCEALVRAEDLSVMGIAEVLPALPRIFRALGTLRRAAEERRPRAALLIDSPDFNLRLARRLRALGVKVVYFIGPSVWAWRTYRVRQIARDVARMLVILPFEAAFYARHGVEATYVGNPLADGASLLEGQGLKQLSASGEKASDLEGQALKDSFGLVRARPVLALLPGSRRQEILRLWPPLLGAARLLLARRPDLQLVVPIAPTIDPATLPTGGLAMTFVAGRAPDVLRAADAAIVASGTATLEAALAQVPLVVVYRLSWLSWVIGRLLVRVKFVSLVNLLAGRLLVPELLQRACTSEAIAAQAGPLLEPGAARDAQLEGLRALRREIAPAGAPNAARRAAQELLQVLESVP
jgi:lipid-A-disaccharide synthase